MSEKCSVAKSGMIPLFWGISKGIWGRKFASGVVIFLEVGNF
jgi:hypothetical protein